MLKTIDRNWIFEGLAFRCLFSFPPFLLLSPCKICLYIHAVVWYVLKSVCHFCSDEKREVSLGLGGWGWETARTVDHRNSEIARGQTDNQNGCFCVWAVQLQFLFRRISTTGSFTMIWARELHISLIILFYPPVVDNIGQFQTFFPPSTSFASVFQPEVIGSKILKKVCFLKHDLNQRPFRIIFFMETVLFL